MSEQLLSIESCKSLTYLRFNGTSFFRVSFMTKITQALLMFSQGFDGLWCLTPLSTILQLYRGGPKDLKAWMLTHCNTKIMQY